jgi:channel protein (hemolysin III family)
LLDKPFPIPGFADPFSSISHLLGAAVFAYLAPALVRRGRGDFWRAASLGVFASCAVFLLAASGIYHLLPYGTADRAVLGQIDRAAIFLLIAASFTPGHVILFRGPWRWAPLLVVWLAAAAGLTVKPVFFGGTPDWVGSVLYLAMGWLGAVGCAALWRTHGWGFVWPMALGGVAYTVGAVIDVAYYPVALAGVVGPHELFHLFVLLGVGLHWRFMWTFADGTIPPLRVDLDALEPPPTPDR